MEEAKKSGINSVPVSWHTGGGVDKDGIPSGPIAATTQAPIICPNEKETAIFSEQRVTTCGSCKHFKHETTQKDFKRSKYEWFKALTDVKQYQWKLRHLPDHPGRLARCGQKDDTLVSVISRSCEYYKPVK